MSIRTEPARVDARGVCTGCRTPVEHCVCPLVAVGRPPLARLAVVAVERCPECGTPHQVYGYR